MVNDTYRSYRKKIHKRNFRIFFINGKQPVNLRSPDLDFIRRIHPESGFYGFMIPFWTLPQKTQNPFLDSEIRIWIFPKQTHPLEVNKDHKCTRHASSRYKNVCYFVQTVHLHSYRVRQLIVFYCF